MTTNPATIQSTTAAQQVTETSEVVGLYFEWGQAAITVTVLAAQTVEVNGQTFTQSATRHSATAPDLQTAIANTAAMMSAYHPGVTEQQVEEFFDFLGKYAATTHTHLAALEAIALSGPQLEQ